MLPNFLIIGAEKSGTTSLAAMLARHPEVYICNPKEPRFFSHNWNRGIGWYRTLFECTEKYKAIGEASPDYTWAPKSKKVPKRIHNCLGDIKYIYIVRNPIDRMISHYRHAVLCHWLPEETPFEEALSKKPALLNCSRYYFQIKQYFPYAKPHQFHIVVLEELKKNPTSVGKGLFNFINVSVDVEPEFEKKYVTDSRRKVPFALESAIKWKILSSIKGKSLFRKISKLIGKKIDPPEFTQETISILKKEIYDDIYRFSQFCKKDLLRIWNF